MSVNPVDAAQSLVVVRPQGTAVRHVVLSIPPRRLGAEPPELEAMAFLQRFAMPSFGPEASAPFCSIGLTRNGLAALGVPDQYRAAFLELAPAYFEGAARRLDRLGDTVAGSNDSSWPELAPAAADSAHVLISWHGARAAVEDRALAFAAAWKKNWPDATLPVIHAGESLAGPGGAPGDWVHFGYRDGISEVCLPGVLDRPAPLDGRRHALGELLLGYADDEGVNRFALFSEVELIRRFYRGSSFGVLRPMAQDVKAFEAWIEATVQLARQNQVGAVVSADYLRGKLCGRWPSGEVMRPGAQQPTEGDFQLTLDKDPEGRGCPFSAHVRRLQGQADRSGPATARPLQRRSLPFDTESAGGGGKKGLIGHFFCADIAVQFEHLMGQWIAKAPDSRPPNDQAADPLAGPRDGDGGSMLIPLDPPGEWVVAGMKDWTRALGTLYAWYPSAQGWQLMLEGTYDVDSDQWRSAAERTHSE